MAKQDTRELMEMMEPFSPSVQKTALWLRDFVWNLYPKSNELIYDNYNALAFGWGLSDRLGDVFCSIAVNRTVNFGFNRGSELADPEKQLLGNGTQYRYIKVHDVGDFPKTYMKKLLREAYANAVTRAKERKQAIHRRTNNCKINFA